jgi:hypothetical protein
MERQREGERNEGREAAAVVKPSAFHKQSERSYSTLFLVLQTKKLSLEYLAKLQPDILKDNIKNILINDTTLRTCL